MAEIVVNVSEAKAKLSKLIDMVYLGETVTVAKNNLPIVDPVPVAGGGLALERLAPVDVVLRRAVLRIVDEHVLEVAQRGVPVLLLEGGEPGVESTQLRDELFVLVDRLARSMSS